MNLHTEGAVDLVGFGVNADSEWGVRCASVFRHVYGLDFPVGVRGGILDEPDRRDYVHARAGRAGTR
ncbi:hypothetical protein [Streptomyces sp. MAR4 CNX-425]|uniref:hypothetical protein n=1 Tax=Streptomyces sp. MAR4 CNX-425 TaxID=3406343 RepID=UPI003B5041F0